jgi:general stress protein 26
MNKSFDREEGLDKMKEMIEAINICMFITKKSDASHVRPMATIKVDDNGDLWFFTRQSSLKIDDLQRNDEVQLLYSHPGKDSYINVTGNASIETSREKVKELWSPLVKAWFPDGVDDPELTLLKVEVDAAYYWDSGTSKMVSFFKMLTAALTGRQVAQGEEGSLIPQL